MNNNDQNIPIAADEKNESFGDEYLKIFSDLADSAIDAAPSQDEANILFMQIAAHCLNFIFLEKPKQFPGLLSIILASLRTFHEGDIVEDAPEELTLKDEYEENEIAIFNNIMPSNDGSD